MAYARAPEGDGDEGAPATERSVAPKVQPAAAPDAAPAKVRPAFVSGGQKRPVSEAGGQPHALGGSTTSASGRSVARVAVAPTTPSALKQPGNDNKPQSIKAEASRPAPRIEAL